MKYIIILLCTIFSLGIQAKTEMIALLGTQLEVSFEQDCSHSEAQRIKDVFPRSLEQGVQCLRDLNTDFTNKNIDLIYRSLEVKERPFQISCPEKLPSARTAAFVYAQKAEFSRNMHFNHNLLDSADLPQTIFHEYFHVIGYDHVTNQEVAYTCAECCFSGNKKSCKLCKEEVNGVKLSSGEYARELERYYRFNIHSESWILNYMHYHMQKSQMELEVVSAFFEMIKRSMPVIYQGMVKQIRPSEELDFELLSIKTLPWEQEKYQNLRVEADLLVTAAVLLYEGNRSEARKILAAMSFKGDTRKGVSQLIKFKRSLLYFSNHS